MSKQSLIKNKAISYSYLMAHIEDAPGYEVWKGEFGDSFESKERFIQEFSNMDLEPREYWIAHYSAHQLALKELANYPMLIEIPVPPRSRTDNIRLGQALIVNLIKHHGYVASTNPMEAKIFMIEDEEFIKLISE